MKTDEINNDSCDVLIKVNGTMSEMSIVQAQLFILKTIKISSDIFFLNFFTE